MAKTVSRRILTGLCVLGLAIIAVSTSVMIAGLDALQASISFEDANQNSIYGRYFVGGEDNGASQSGAGALFGSGGINEDVAIELLTIINSVTATTRTWYDASHFSAFVESKTNKNQGAIYVRLFAPILTGTTQEKLFTYSNHAHHGEVGEARWWRVVFLCDDVVTLWMADPYRVSSFGSVPYSMSSTVRNNLVNDFQGVVSAYDSDGQEDINSAIVPAQSSRVAWQNQDVGKSGYGMGNGYAFSNPLVPSGELVWLPSAYEVFLAEDSTANVGTFTAYTTMRGGQWNVSGLDRAYSRGSFTVGAGVWIRSNYYNNANKSSISFPSYPHSNPDRSDGVRPAMHLDMNVLRAHANSTIHAGIE